MTYVLQTYGAAVLRHKAEPVDRVTAAVRRLADEMIRAMKKHEGVGLAAPQIGKSQRLVVLYHPELHPKPLVMLNPEILKRAAEFFELGEGCLSLPGVNVNVSRPSAVRVKYQDLKGAMRETEYEGLMARIVYHEVDHLNGKLIIDYLPLDQRLRFEAQIKRARHPTRATGEKPS